MQQEHLHHTVALNLTQGASGSVCWRSVCDYITGRASMHAASAEPRTQHRWTWPGTLRIHPVFHFKNNLWPLHIQKIFVTVNFLVSPPSVTIGAWSTGEAALPSSGSEPSYLAQSDPYSGTLRAVHSIRNAALGRTGDGTWLQLESLWRQKTFSSQMELSSTIYIEV